MKLEEAVKIFKVFSDPKRLRIFLLLLDSELCVCELMDILKVEQSLLSHQLKIMREAGLVETRRRGRWVFYYVPEKRRQELSLLFEAWLKEELIQARKRSKMVKDKKVCPLGFQREKSKEKSKVKVLIASGLKKKNKK